MCLPHQRQHPPHVEHDNDPNSHHIHIYQALDCLEERIDLPPLGGDGTIAPMLRCLLEGAIGVRRQGRVSVTPKVEPPLAPPLVRQ
jgi:hypothetical protein